MKSEFLSAFADNEKLLRRVISKYTSRPADIDDLVQETFLRAFAAQLSTTVRNPKAFLLRVARNLAINEVKKKVNSSSVSIEDFDHSEVYEDEGSNSPERRLADRQKLILMVEAMASLPPQLRETFEMRKVEGLKFRQIAARLNVSVSTVEKRAAMALREIDSYLSAAGYPQDNIPSPIAKSSAHKQVQRE